MIRNSNELLCSLLYFCRMSFSPLVKLHFYGDSHFCDHHFFQESLNDVIGNLKAWRYSSVEGTNIHAAGGAHIDKNLIETFCSTMKDEGPFPQAHVFQVGGNNLRQVLRGCSKHSKNDVKTLFDLLVQEAGYQPNVHLVFCSIIPSPKHEPFSNNLFGRLTNTLKILLPQLQKWFLSLT